MFIAAAALVTGSCNKSMDVPFQITKPSHAFIVQTQSEGTTYFTPLIGFTTYSSSSTAVSAEALHGNLPLMGGHLYLNNTFETFSSANQSTDIASLSGTYTLKATDDKGKTATHSFDISLENTDAMDLGEGITELKVENFDYKDGKITATIYAVEGATQYLFFMIPVIEGTPQNGTEIRTLIGGQSSPSIDKTTDLKQTISWSFSSNHDYWIYPVAANKKGVLIIGKGKFLPKDGSGFPVE